MNVHDIHIHSTMNALAEYLRENSLTDDAFAARVGCSRSMITKLRTGKAAPSLRLAVAISREVNLSVEELFPGEVSEAAE